MNAQPNLQPQIPQKKNNPIAKLAMFFAKIAERWIPDAFVFAIILTMITFIGGMLIGNTPYEMMIHWGDGFWGLLAFTAQIMTTFIMSYALAITKPVSRALEKLASICKTPTSAILVVTFTALFASLISWAFGLVVAAIIARLVGRKVHDVDYRVLVAAGYSGFVIWEGGLSSSPSLFVATEGHVFQDIVGLIPTSQTLLSPLNVVLVCFIFFTLPFVMLLIHPKNKEERFIIDQKLLKDEEIKEEQSLSDGNSPNDKLDKSRGIVMLGGLLGLFYLGNHFYLNGFSLDLNTVNLIFLTSALLLYGNVRELGVGLKKASGSVGQFALQYPFYAGIMGMMGSSGLALWISNIFADISTTKTLPLFTFWAAGVVNMFIPSGGGQWAVQAPIFLPLALEMAVEPAKIVLAVAWGDAWTNMIQPFWAVPLLVIAGLKIRDIMGFTMITLFYTGVIISAVFFILG